MSSAITRIQPSRRISCDRCAANGRGLALGFGTHGSANILCQHELKPVLSPIRPVNRARSMVIASAWRKANWEDTAALVLVIALSIAAALAFATLSRSPSWTGGRSDLDKQAPALQDSVNKLKASVASDEATLAGLKKAIAKDEARIASLEFQLTALESFLAIGGVVFLSSKVLGGVFPGRLGTGAPQAADRSNGAANATSSSEAVDK